MVALRAQIVFADCYLQSTMKKHLPYDLALELIRESELIEALLKK
jgi:hypothetical protein